MKKKASYILLALGISLAITGCKTKLDEKKEVETVVGQEIDKKEEEKEVKEETKEEKSEDKKEPAVSESKQEKKLLVEKFYSDDKLAKTVFKYVYDDGSASNERTVISPNFDLKLDLIGLEYEGDQLKEKEIIESYDLKDGEKLLLKAVYPEGIPMLKLKWTVAGRTDEYILEYNGKDGGPDRLEFKY